MEYINSVIELMRNVIDEEEKREVLQTDFQPMLNLLLDLTTLFPDQRKEAQEALKIWMQLLHNSFTEARSLLHRPQPGRPRRCLDRLICNPRTLSQEINEWKVLFDCLFQELQREILHFKEAMEIITLVMELMRNVINEEEKREVLQTDFQPMLNLLLDLTTLFPDQRKEAQEAVKIWMQLLHNCLTHAKIIVQRLDPGRRRRCLECIMYCNPGRVSKEINEWKVLFDCLFQDLQSDFTLFVTARHILHSTEGSEPSLSEDDAASEEQSLCEDEAWMLFQRIAFKDGPAPMEIQLCARNIVDACKGSRVVIRVVAAAMIGKTSLVDWQTSLHSINTADHPSFPHNHPRIDPQLYQLFKWSYDSLPTSDLKNCFLSSAIYPEDANINVTELVQMWIAEGFVRSKQETHLMDMAIARSYVNFLLDRCFFHNASSNEEIQYYNPWHSSDGQLIRVDGDIREMAMYIAEKEQNCLFKAGQSMQNFPTEDIKDCKRISLHRNRIEDLPSEFRCPKLVSLILSDNYRISVVPSGFLVGLTSLKVLDLSNNRISSIPSSVGQLQQLQLLRLEDLGIEHLPEEIGHLSSLQFLSLKHCRRLESLPSQIGQLQNLKYLNISHCYGLRVIPHELSQLTSLTTLDAWNVELRVEAESERSICRLKGLINLTMLKIEGGIMGTWLDMRHLELWFPYGEYVTGDFPDDMQNMRKLQSLRMFNYRGLSLPEYSCKFQHLQHLELNDCRHLKELSPLERLPNLKYLELYDCRELKELGIGNYGKATGFLMLEVLVLQRLWKLESMAGASNSGVWNERTLPKLRLLKISDCPNLKRFPVGMDKLLNLNTVRAENDWWQQIFWENDHMKIHLTNLFKDSWM